MDITAEALEKLREIIRAEQSIGFFERHGRSYLTKPAILLPKEVRPDPLKLHTLAGLKKYLEDTPGLVGEESQVLITVDSPKAVSLIGPAGGDDGQRDRYAIVTLDVALQEFPWGRYMDPETFIIALQTMMVSTPELDQVLKLAGSVRAERVLELADDGVSQKVTVRKGLSQSEQVIVPNPVVLRPYRTFREIEQPESPFLLRARNPKDEASTPEFALFEADGGAWRLTAIEQILAYFSGVLVPVLA